MRVVNSAVRLGGFVESLLVSRLFLRRSLGPQGACFPRVSGGSPGSLAPIRASLEVRAHDVLPDLRKPAWGNALHLRDDRLAPDPLQRRAAFHPAAKSISRWKIRLQVLVPGSRREGSGRLVLPARFLRRAS